MFCFHNRNGGLRSHLQKDNSESSPALLRSWQVADCSCLSPSRGWPNAAERLHRSNDSWRVFSRSNRTGPGIWVKNLYIRSQKSLRGFSQSCRSCRKNWLWCVPPEPSAGGGSTLIAVWVGKASPEPTLASMASCELSASAELRLATGMRVFIVDVS